MILSELPERCFPLLGGDPVAENKSFDGVKYILYKSKHDNSFLIARTTDGENPTDIMLNDIDMLNRI